MVAPLNFHPLSTIFPLIEGAEFAALVEDIRAVGLRSAIWLHPDGSIIDGRNRYRGCIEAGVEPRFRTWSGKGSLVAFLLSLNLRRRSLNESQKALVAANLLGEESWLAEEAKKRQGMRTDLAASVQQGDMGRAAEHAARLIAVSTRYVYHALHLKRAAQSNPQAQHFWDEVFAGRMTLTQALRLLAKDAITEAAQLPSDKFRVIYADPPWEYGDQLTEDYGPTQFHYPAKPLAELCDMPVQDLAEDNAVLFLWVTSPLLEQAFPVISAWGFEYKTSFVWDKVKHNMGHYNSVRHEFLLVATRGSCTPDVAKLYDSVVTIERTGYSRKPPEFRQMIEALYPHGKRLELFARETVPTWQPWGNDAAIA
jgi:N6-adenosine-specific RNA methylase IME4